jgi:sigma-B regulation protein RsbU (phosphoserine phosphatase)
MVRWIGILGGSLQPMACRLYLCLHRHLLSYLALTLIFLGLAAPVLPAQSFDASHLWRSADLATTWLVHAGDDPRYSGTDFDDSQWTRFDLNKSITTLYGQSRPPIVWYRLHVKVDPSQKGLALSEWNTSQAFEIYVNGERLIGSGRVAPYAASTMAAKLVARIPDQMVESGSVLIAMRVHISSVEWEGQFPGLYPTNLRLGQQDALYRENWLTAIGSNELNWIDHLLLFCVGLVALVLFAAQRRQTEYLWIFAIAALYLVETIVPTLMLFENIPTAWNFLSICLRVVTPYLWVSLYFSFVHQRIGWGWRTYLIIAGILNAFSGLQGVYLTIPLIFQFISNLPFIALLSLVVPIVLGIHWRRGNREAGILLIPTVLFSLYIYIRIGLQVLFQFEAWSNTALRGLNLIDQFPLGPFTLSLNNVSNILSTISLAVIMLLRSSNTSRRQAQLESELEAAQQVQQVLVPEQTAAVPGFVVDSVYQPAQQVGGDFFQIFPDDEGGLLVVVGDVAGKGLPAAMLVSVIVGAVRGAAEYTNNPAELLTNLNERLVGRGSGGFSTALVARISAGGAVVIANAGHLSPYLDGREVELPGALPLGVAAGVEYSTTEFYLAPGRRLTFYSDGVVEAQNSEGEPFGFDRASEISTQSAANIVEAAKHFGQQEDITVVTIERAGVVATAA